MGGVGCTLYELMVMSLGIFCECVCVCGRVWLVDGRE